MNAGTLIVGASQAGLQIACSLRELGYDAPITLVGSEPHLPYPRPPLSKAFLAGTTNEDRLALRNSDFYTDHRIDIAVGQRISDIVLDGSGAGVASTDSGEQWAFSALALTVGARPRRLTIDGSELDGICYLRDMADAIALRRQLPDAEHVVVIGGGFIGLEAAAVARAAGKTVTVVEVADRLIARAVAPVMSEFYRDAHEKRGTRVVLGLGVTAISGTDGRVTSVVLSDGSEIRADLVLVGIGVQPRTELAVRLGLQCTAGIVVDEYARTSNGTTVATGDCAVLPDPTGGDSLIRLESVQNAVDQSRVAAATLMGTLEPYRAVPWFWSDQDTLKLHIAGLSTGYDSHVVRGEPSSESFSVLYYRGETLCAADSINNPQDFMAVKRALAQGMSIAKADASNTDTPLKSLYTARV